MKQSLNLKLSQQLTLTPQLKQSLRLLQISTLDLEHEIQKTLDSNPLLERLDNESIELDDKKSTEKNDFLNSTPERKASTEASENDFESHEQDDSNWQEALTNHNHSFDKSGEINSTNSDAEFTQFISKDETLFEHLYWQVQMTTLSDKDKLIAHTLLRSLDDDGYLNLELNEVCDMFDGELEIETDEIAAVLSLIKTLEPAGVGARNLGERLAIQLNQLNTNTNCPHLHNAQRIVNDHLHLLATRNTLKLKKELAISDEELAQSLSLITSLNPRISSQFSNDSSDHIAPDLIISKQDNGEISQWVANLNPENQTKLRVNETYSDLLQSNINQEGSDYIQKNLIEAKIFIKNIMSRYDTLLLVGQAIVKRQQAFFELGEQHMQPMVLQDIASELEMHESTISRATAGKYLLSPRGVVELKYFFSSAISTTDGATSSSTAIRSLIKKMVASESKKKPLSDNKIAKELEQQGHIVARRTVAKYRESMHIAPSSQRKSLF